MMRRRVLVARRINPIARPSLTKLRSMPFDTNTESASQAAAKVERASQRAMKIDALSARSMHLGA